MISYLQDFRCRLLNLSAHAIVPAGIADASLGCASAGTAVAIAAKTGTKSLARKAWKL